MRVEVKAWLKTLCRATKRGPGVDAIGSDGGGDGDDGFSEGILDRDRVHSA